MRTDAVAVAGSDSHGGLGWPSSWPGLSAARIAYADSMQLYQGMDIGTAKYSSKLPSRMAG